jgi:hypothetical protein
LRNMQAWDYTKPVGFHCRMGNGTRKMGCLIYFGRQQSVGAPVRIQPYAKVRLLGLKVFGTALCGYRNHGAASHTQISRGNGILRIEQYDRGPTLATVCYSRLYRRSDRLRGLRLKKIGCCLDLEPGLLDNSTRKRGTY